MLRRIGESSIEGDLKVLLQRLVLAGSSVATAILQREPFDRLWPEKEGEASLREKSFILTKFLVLAMANRYLGSLQPAKDVETTTSAIEKFVELLLQTFADHDQQSLKYRSAIARQYLADQSRDRNISLADILLLNEVAGVLTGQTTSRVDAKDLPLYEYSHAQLVDRGVRGFPIETMVALVSTFHLIYGDAVASHGL